MHPALVCLDYHGVGTNIIFQGERMALLTHYIFNGSVVHLIYQNCPSDYLKNNVLGKK